MILCIYYYKKMSAQVLDLLLSTLLLK